MTDGNSTGGWAAYPVDPSDEQHPGRSEVDDDGELLRDADSSARVVGLGAICGPRTWGLDDDGRSRSFWVGEFALLATGRRVILHEARGFTIGAPIGPGARGAVQAGLGRKDVIGTVLAVVLPDPDDGEDHPWTWLAQLARARGLDVTAADLHDLPYEVVLTDGLTRWLDTS